MSPEILSLRSLIQQKVGINQFVPGPVCVIGDVHGCAVELEELLEKCVKVYSPNRIYQLGDLIDRGPELLRVFKVCESYGVHLLIGNHELAFYNEILGSKKCNSSARLKTHESFNQLRSVNQDFILEKIATAKNRINLGLDDGRQYILTHAPFALRYEREMNGAATLYTTSREGPNEEQLVLRNVHGHAHWLYTDIHKQIADGSERSYNIDSGCVYGSKLTALELNSLTAVQVNAHDVYFQDRTKHE